MNKYSPKRASHFIFSIERVELQTKISYRTFKLSKVKRIKVVCQF